MRAGLVSIAFFLGVCPFAGAGVAPVALPPIPLGFEKTSDGYQAQTLGASFSIRGTGFGVRSRTGLVDISFAGANRRARLLSLGVAATLNRLTGNDASLWRTGVPLASQVTESCLYPGIDLIYRGGDRGGLEYDLLVEPGADARRIELSVQGVTGAAVDGSGDLEIQTRTGSLVQRRPFAYQTLNGKRHEIGSSFRVDAMRRIHIDLGPYDHAKLLTIDPQITYLTYLGGSGEDTATSIAVDGSGDIFVAGSTSSTSAGNQNVLLFKLPHSGTPTQSVFGGTTGTDSANAMVLDGSGDVFLAGSTSSNNFPIVGNQFTGVESGITGALNAFVIAFPPSISTPAFSTYIGGNESDRALGIALGPGNMLYVVGDTNSTSFPEFAPSSQGSVPFQDANHGGYDAFAAGLTTAGVGVFSTYLGGSADDHAYGVTVDSSGYVYIAGSTASTDFPVSGSASTVNHGGTDAFVIKLLPTAVDGDWGIWSVLVGGSENDSASGLALDSKSNVYVTGTTASTDFPSTAGVYQASFQGGQSDGFVFELENSDTTTIVGAWSTYLGTANDDALNAIAVDSAGNILLTGTTDSLAWPVTADASQPKSGGAQDAVIAKMNGTGTGLLFSTYLGGSGNEIGNAITVDSLGRIYVAGLTSSSGNDLPVTAGAYQPAYGGGSSDAFFGVLGCSNSKPAIAAGGIGNAGSFSTAAISPGAAIAIFGTNLACTAASASQLPLPSTLGGVSVSINGAAAPVFFADSGQINAQVPYGVAAGAATVTVTNAAGTSEGASITVAAAAPGIFTAGQHAAAINQDGTVNSTAHGAAPGSIISVYFTGQGPVTPAVETGAAASATTLSSVTLPNSATIGPQSAAVQFMGLAPGFAGLAQANLMVPPNLTAGDYPVTITIDGFTSQAAMISVGN